MPYTPFSLLRIPPDRLEEIAVVVCDTCPQNAFPQKALEKALAVPFTCFSTSQLQASPSLASRRVQLASCVISVSSCSLRCPFHLLSSLRFPEHSLLLSPSDVPQETANQLHDLAASMLSHLTPSLPPPLSAASRSSSFSAKETRQPSLPPPPLPSSSRPPPTSSLSSLPSSSFSPSSSFASSASLPRRLDYRGLSCPMPIVRLQKDLTLIEDEIIEIIADDPAFPTDLEAFCLQKKFSILSVQNQGSLFSATITSSPSSSKSPSLPSSSDAPIPATPSASVPLFLPSLSPPSSPSSPPFTAASSVEPWKLSSSLEEPLLENSALTPFPIFSDPRPLNSEQIAKILPSESDLSSLFSEISFLSPSNDLGVPPNLFGEILPEKPSPLLPSSPLEKLSSPLDLPRLSPSQTSEKRSTSAELPRISSNSAPKTPSSSDLKASGSPASNPPLLLDCRGLKCPLPIIRLGQFTKKNPRASIEISSDDPAFPADLEAFCQTQRFEILTQAIQGNLSSFVVQPRS